MPDNDIYTKKLCMSELVVQHSKFQNSHYFDAGSGKVNSSFGFIIKGSVRINTMGRSLTIPTGSLFYIPEGIRYNSVWRGEPDIEFYSLHIVSKLPDTSTAQTYSLARLDALSNPETEARIAEIYRLFATGERLCMVRAIGLYYLLYADILPCLTPDAPPKYNLSLLAALDYIDKNYKADFGVDELAQHCCVSESQLYHLFRNELDLTPIQYRNELRIEKAAGSLRTTSDSIDKIAEDCGFNSSALFRRTFRKVTGMSPSEYRSIQHS